MILVGRGLVPRRNAPAAGGGAWPPMILVGGALVPRRNAPAAGDEPPPYRTGLTERLPLSDQHLDLHRIERDLGGGVAGPGDDGRGGDGPGPVREGDAQGTAVRVELPIHHHERP